MQERNIRPRNAKDEYAQRIEESIAQNWNPSTNFNQNIEI